MLKLFLILLILGLIILFIHFLFKKQDLILPTVIKRRPPVSTTKEQSNLLPTKKTTTPNNTNSWIYFYSRLYGYSLRRPANFRKVLGNEDLFQATSKDYEVKDGVVTHGAIAQTITSDKEKSFEEAWGSESRVAGHDSKLLNRENLLVGQQKAYKYKIQNSDGTIEIRYLTYKSPYSYNISILTGKNSLADSDKYEQILDDIVSTFKF